MKTALLLFCVLHCEITQAQNLVPNPSFEDTVQCPIASGDPTQSLYWTSASLGSAFYDNACSSPNDSFANWGVPWNVYAYQFAHTGNAYMEIYALNTYPVPTRTYIQIELLDTLISNQNYEVQFYVSLGDSSKWGCDSIEAYFSDTLIFQSTDTTLVYYHPQVENQPGNSLNSKTGWILVSDTFIAQGGEKFMTIGNFFDNAHSSYYPVKGGAPWSVEAYMLIDDVSVRPLSNVGIDLITLQNLVKVYPNPVKNDLSVYFGNNSYAPFNISISDCQGKQYYEEKNIERNKVTLDVSALAGGIYFLNCRSQSYSFTRKFAKIN